MTGGLILLLLIAALAGYGWVRLRRRLGMHVTGRGLAIVMAGVVIVVAAMWAYSTHR